MASKGTIRVQSVEDYYARYAGWYDVLMQPFAHLRANALRQLHVFAGARVLELGCGTGTSFRALVSLLEPTGQLFGVDRSRAMLRQARRKIKQAAWRQVTLLQADADDLAFSCDSVDAVLAFYTNDIFRSGQAIAHAVQALRPNGRFVIAGAKLTKKHRWLPIDWITRGYANKSIRQPLTSQPWQELEQQLGALTIEEYLGGSAFLAYGIKQSKTHEVDS